MKESLITWIHRLASKTGHCVGEHRMAWRSREGRQGGRYEMAIELEPLESRTLLSASFDMASGLLTIEGTQNKDAITVSAGQELGEVSLKGVDGIEKGTLFAGVEAIQIDSLGGDDKITISKSVVDAGGNPIDVTINAGDGNDKIKTGDGNHVIDAGEGKNKITTGDGDNVITTGSGDDSIKTGDGTNVIDAGEGKNKITAGDGDDVITTGSGNDSIKAGDGANVVVAGEGKNKVTTGDGDDDITTGSGDDSIKAGDGTNVVTAGEGKNKVTAGDGNDEITTGSGNDSVKAGHGDNIVDVGDGKNKVTAKNGDNIITTGEGDDSIKAGHGNNVIAAGEGKNKVTAGDGNDDITTGSGNDSVKAGDGNNIIDVGEGKNKVTAGEGDDVITTGDGDDSVKAGHGDNIVEAGEGKNKVTTGDGDDQITTGSGNDSVKAGRGANTIDPGEGKNTVINGGGNDTIATPSLVVTRFSIWPKPDDPIVTTDNEPTSGGFNIDFDIAVNAPDRIFSLMEAAVGRWSNIIIGDLPDVNVSGIGEVDDLFINVIVAPIDGPGNGLAQAGPETFRPGTLLPSSGTIQIDSADLDHDQMFDIIVHEIAHVLGLGVLWDDLNLVIDGPGINNPRFIGPQTVAVYSQLTGREETSVPLANTGGPGTFGVHWREDVFQNELMTGFIDSGMNPISKLTVAQFADLGYLVNFEAADPYTLPEIPEGSVHAPLLLPSV